jgi:D-glycerate 3-kinase
VPGTHDVSLGLAVLDACGRRGKVALPRFSKADDTRCAPEQWPVITTPVNVVIFEGWCVGARPQLDSALVAPVDEFERNEDSDGRWRHWVNRQLATTYPPLFARIDLLVLMAAPDFAVVASWRKQQEAALRDRLAAEGRPKDDAMTDREIDRFVAHFQRLTEYILVEMPQRADLVVRLDRQRLPVEPSTSLY